MSRYCLDTSTYSHFKRGEPQAVELIDGAKWLGISTIVLGELGAGFLHGTQRGLNEAQLAEFLSNRVVEVIGVDTEVSRYYAEIFVDLRRAGTLIPTNDIWIAAAAARHGALLLTYDHHFNVVSKVGSVVLRA